MTIEQETALLAAGWRIIETGFWASPVTGLEYTEREALVMLALPDYRMRRRMTRPGLYRARR